MTEVAACNLRWAWQLLDGFAAAGITRVVLSPGARSTPLALAALRHPRLQTEIILDERSAGFFALGLAKAEGKPAVLIATSGSAIANWFPAVVEADVGDIPLLCLSADRPPELQDCGANQTFSQLQLFGQHVRAFHALPPAETANGWLTSLAAQSLAQTLSPRPGPVHLNIPFREPLVPQQAVPLPSPSPAAAHYFHPPPLLSEAALDQITEQLGKGNGAIVCGHQPMNPASQAAISRLAERLQVPVFADLLSGLRSPALNAQVLAYPDRVAEKAPCPDWVLHFGGAPISRAMNDWLKRCVGSTHLMISSSGQLNDPARLATHVIHTEAADFCTRVQGQAAEPAWTALFQQIDQAAAKATAHASAGEAMFSGKLFQSLFSLLPRSTPVFLGNSLTVRLANLFAGCPSAPLSFFANRGLSGIDGNLSTAAGLAASRGNALALVGDLTFLHDLNALALCRKHRLVVLLLDNGGGGIFDHLPQAQLPEFETGWLTPQSFDAAAAAATFGLTYHAPDTVNTAIRCLTEALQAPQGSVIHLTLDRAHEQACLAHFHSLFHSGD